MQMLVDFAHAVPQSDVKGGEEKSDWERFLEYLKSLGEDGAKDFAASWLSHVEVLEEEDDFFEQVISSRDRGVAAIRHYKVKSEEGVKLMSFYIQDRFNSDDTTCKIQSEMFCLLAVYLLANDESILGWLSIAELPLFAPNARMVKDFYAVVELMRASGNYKTVVVPHSLSSMPETNYKDFADRSLRRNVKDIVNKAFVDFVALTAPVLNLVANKGRKKGQPRVHIQLEENLQSAIDYLKESDWDVAESRTSPDLEFSGLIDLIVPTPTSGVDVTALRKSG